MIAHVTPDIQANRKGRNLIAHVTYADDSMSISADLSRQSAVSHGCDVTIKPFITDSFMDKHKGLLKEPRGAGYWIWKPHIIYNALCELDKGDILVYTDAGVEFIADINLLIDKLDSVCMPAGDIMLFGNHYQHRDWCKREVFDGLDCKDGHQVQASAMVFRKNIWTKDFVLEWWDWCETRGPRGQYWVNDSQWMEQYPEFQEHRHDQAILTCLAQKHNIPLHWWPAVYNDGAFTYEKGTYMDMYPPIFHHHRKRNHEW